MASSQGDHHSRFAAPDDCPWYDLDSTLRTHLFPLLSDMSNGRITTAEAGDAFSNIVSSFVLNTAIRRPRGPHRPRSMEKLVNKTTIAKNQACRSFRSDPPMFLNAVRAHNKVIRAARKSDRFRSSVNQEAAFRQNPWKFAASVCCS